MLTSDSKAKTDVDPGKAAGTDDQHQRDARACEYLQNRNSGRSRSQAFRSRSRRAGARAFGGVARKQLAQFTHQLATLQDAGLTILHSLQILERQLRPGLLRRVVKEMGQDINDGATLAEAMAGHPEVFDRVYVQMVAAGEASGKLEMILVDLQRFLEGSVRVRRQVIMAMIYPAAVLLFAFCVVAFVTYVAGFDLGFGGWTLLIGLAGAAVAAGLAVKVIRQSDAGRYVFDLMKLKIPVFGKIVQKTAMCRATRTLGTLLGAGVPILEAVEVSRETAGNAALARVLGRVYDSVEAGHSIVEPFRAARMIEPTVVDMVAVGEETGDLDQMLLKVAEILEEEVQMRIHVLLSLLKPTVMIIVALVVAMLIVKMWMQIPTMAGGLGAG